MLNLIENLNNAQVEQVIFYPNVLLNKKNIQNILIIKKDNNNNNLFFYNNNYLYNIAEGVFLVVQPVRRLLLC
jgi:hypothetical protein